MGVGGFWAQEGNDLLLLCLHNGNSHSSRSHGSLHAFNNTNSDHKGVKQSKQ